MQDRSTDDRVNDPPPAYETLGYTAPKKEGESSACDKVIVDTDASQGVNAASSSRDSNSSPSNTLEQSAEPGPSCAHIKKDELPNSVDLLLEYIHHIKWINFRGSSRPIITQNENGPCPLIAIANVLLLRGTIDLPNANDLITGQRLVALLSDVLLSQPIQNLDSSHLLNYETNVSDALNLFPMLQTGLDVNVRFTGVSDFEYTSALSVFDLFKIDLFHGWLVDPADEALLSIVGNRTYNQLAEHVISLKASDSTTEVQQGLMIEDFLDRTASQLTYHGLWELTAAMKNDQLAVFFRNNHFNTILKREDRVFVLVTDISLMNEPSVVWEVLDDVDGDTAFVDSSFRLYRPSAESKAQSNQSAELSKLPPTTTTEAASVENQSDDQLTTSDQKLAMQLQLQEYEADSVKRSGGAGTQPELDADKLAQLCSRHLDMTDSDDPAASDLRMAACMQLEQVAEAAQQPSASRQPRHTPAGGRTTHKDSCSLL